MFDNDETTAEDNMCYCLAQMLADVVVLNLLQNLGTVEQNFATPSLFTEISSEAHLQQKALVVVIRDYSATRADDTLTKQGFETGNQVLEAAKENNEFVKQLVNGYATANLCTVGAPPRVVTHYLSKEKKKIPCVTSDVNDPGHDYWPPIEDVCKSIAEAALTAQVQNNVNGAAEQRTEQRKQFNQHVTSAAKFVTDLQPFGQEHVSSMVTQREAEKIQKLVADNFDKLGQKVFEEMNSNKVYMSEDVFNSHRHVSQLQYNEESFADVFTQELTRCLQELDTLGREEINDKFMCFDGKPAWDEANKQGRTNSEEVLRKYALVTSKDLGENNVKKFKNIVNEHTNRLRNKLTGLVGELLTSIDRVIQGNTVETKLEIGKAIKKSKNIALNEWVALKTSVRRNVCFVLSSATENTGTTLTANQEAWIDGVVNCAINPILNNAIHDLSNDLNKYVTGLKEKSTSQIRSQIKKFFEKGYTPEENRVKVVEDFEKAVEGDENWKAVMALKESCAHTVVDAASEELDTMKTSAVLQKKDKDTEQLSAALDEAEEKFEKVLNDALGNTQQEEAYTQPGVVKLSFDSATLASKKLFATKLDSNIYEAGPKAAEAEKLDLKLKEIRSEFEEENARRFSYLQDSRVCGHGPGEMSAMIVGGGLEYVGYLDPHVKMLQVTFHVAHGLSYMILPKGVTLTEYGKYLWTGKF